jgi:uncharacterized protein (DUF58 family)
MLSKELIKQIRYLEFKAKHLVTNVLAGEYSSAFRGQGMEFDKVREYFEGDDIRSIDWNVTARMSSPFVKVYSEERELTLMLIIDVSPSLEFSSEKNFKTKLVAELAAILAFMATKNKDKVGLLIFSDHVEKFVPPQKGMSHIWHIIRTILAHKSKGSNKTDISGALSYFANVCKKRSMCFVISDFYSKDYHKSLQQIARKHDVTCVQMLDEREVEIPNIGNVSFVNPENKQVVSVNSGSSKFREMFMQKSQAEQEKLKLQFLRSGADFFTIDTKNSVVNPLVGYLKKREHRSR